MTIMGTVYRIEVFRDANQGLTRTTREPSILRGIMLRQTMLGHHFTGFTRWPRNGRNALVMTFRDDAGIAINFYIQKAY